MAFITAALIWAGIVVVSMIIASWLAARWGRDPFGWALLTAVLGPIALVGLIGTRQSDTQRPGTMERSAARGTGGRCVLAPVDGSDASLRVARYIAETQPAGTEVALIAVLTHEQRPSGGAGEAEHRQRVSAMTGAAEAIVREAGLPARVIVGYGAPGETIVRAAGDENPDLIVVGRRGAGLSKALLGSTSDHVVKHAQHPVVVIG
jgi:nucleotide-binding universal stress UspA family protein